MEMKAMTEKEEGEGGCNLSWGFRYGEMMAFGGPGGGSQAGCRNVEAESSFGLFFNPETAIRFRRS